MLIAAVQSNIALNQVHSMEMMQRTRGDAEIPYDTYLEIIRTAAFQADHAKSSNSKRSGNQHSRNNRSANNGNSNRNQSKGNNNNRNNYIPAEQWNKMSREEKQKFLDNKKRNASSTNRSEGNPGTTQSMRPGIKYSVPDEVWKTMSYKQQQAIKDHNRSIHETNFSNHTTTVNSAAITSSTGPSNQPNAGHTATAPTDASQPILQSILSTSRATNPQVPERIVSDIISISGEDVAVVTQ